MAAQPEPVAMAVQPELGFEVIKQHPGPVQVSRKVLVNVPGKHFPNLQAAEQRREYVPGVPGTPIEYSCTVCGAPQARAPRKGVGSSAPRAGHALHLRVGRYGRPGPQGRLDRMFTRANPSGKTVKVYRKISY